MDTSCTRRSVFRIPGTLVAAAAALALALANANGATAQATCSGGNAIGISLDSSGSVRRDFPIVSRQIVEFVNSTSGITSSTAGTANDNQYYVNTFSTIVTDSTGSFAANTGGAVANAVTALLPSFGGTNIDEGIADLSLEFVNASSAAAGIAIVFTDGQDASPLAEADALRAAGITVAAVGIGRVNLDVLKDIASERANGSDIVFTGDTFEQIGDLFSSVIQSIDTDGDGVDDCADGCPDDPNKVDPGECGCGVPEGCIPKDMEMPTEVEKFCSVMVPCKTLESLCPNAMTW